MRPANAISCGLPHADFARLYARARVPQFRAARNLRRCRCSGELTGFEREVADAR